MTYIETILSCLYETAFTLNERRKTCLYQNEMPEMLQRKLEQK